jgi:hypothetical protein
MEHRTFEFWEKEPKNSIKTFANQQSPANASIRAQQLELAKSGLSKNTKKRKQFQ